MSSDRNGQPVESAQIQVANQATGVKSYAVTRTNGNYYVQGVEVGGPYVISVRRIGFAPDSVTGVRLSLGQNFRASFKLHTQAAQLALVTVRATSRQHGSPSDPAAGAPRTSPTRSWSPTGGACESSRH